MPDATNRVLKEQSMVVRRTETRDFGLTAGWFEEDGTTTTYQPYARSGGGRRRLETGPVARIVQPSSAARASSNARRPSGVQPKVATPAPDDFELLELDDLEDPFATRRSAASASAWNVLGFAVLFASVLIGRVAVEAGQQHARLVESRTGAKQSRTPESPQPSAAAVARGSAGAGADPLSAARDGSPGSAQPLADVEVESPRGETSTGNASAAKLARGAQRVGAEPAGNALPAVSAERASASGAKREAEPSPTESLAVQAAKAPHGTTAAPSSAPRPAALGGTAQSTSAATDSPPSAAKARSAQRSAQQRTESSDWRDGPMEPAASSFVPPPAASAALGTLRINSRPWSQVFIDGRWIGNTPQMSVNVPPGRYTVRLANPELGMSKTIIVHVSAGELVTRVESLE